MNAATDGAVLADTFKHGTGAGITAANGAVAVLYAPVAPLGSGIAAVADLVGVTPAAPDPTGSFGGAASGRHRQRREPGPLVHLQPVEHHGRRLPGAGRRRPELSWWRAEEHLQRRELPVVSRSRGLTAPSRSIRDGASSRPRNEGYSLTHVPAVHQRLHPRRAHDRGGGDRNSRRARHPQLHPIPGALEADGGRRPTSAAAFTAERAYYPEHSFYSSCLSKIGFSPERGNRYRYTLNSTLRSRRDLQHRRGSLDAPPERASGRTGTSSPTPSSTGPAQGSPLPTPRKPAPVYTPLAPDGNSTIVVQNDLVGVVPATADPAGSFGVAAHGDIDSDPDLDLWYVSSVSSSPPVSALP